MSETKVITGKVRFSYAHVFKPSAMSEGDPEKYSVAILIPKSDTATLKKVEAAIKTAYDEGKEKHSLPKNFSMCKTPLRDGDDEKPDDENYEGMMFMNANSLTRPGIIDIEKKEIMSDEDYANLIRNKSTVEIEKIDEERSDEEFYSGCWGRVSVNIYAYSKKGKGIACGLGNIQKFEDGDRLSGNKSSATEDFADDFDPLA